MCPFTLPKPTNAAFRCAAVCIANFKHSKCNKHIIASFQTHAVLTVFLRAHVVSHHSNSDGISPSLTLMSPSNFHKMRTFLRVTNTCHCLVMMTYTNIQRIAFLFHFQTKLIPKPPGLLLCSLHHHYIRPPASAAPLTPKLPTMCLVPRRPPEKETLVWRLLAFVPPFSGI